MKRFDRGSGAGIALTLLLGLVAPVLGQGAPEIPLEGRESVERMKGFDPFLGRWTRVEYPPGTPIDDPDGGCFFRTISRGIAVEVGCGPWDSPAEAAHVFWHPADRELVFQLYSVLNPVDLLFQGVYEFPDSRSVRRTYRGYYGDGRIHRYRETWVLEAPDRLVQRTERFTDGQWTQIFDGSVYVRTEDAEAKGG